MMRGSSDILAAVDCHISIEKKKDEPDQLIIKQSKLRQDEELKPFEIKILKNNTNDKGKLCPSGIEYVGDYDDKKKKAEEVSEAITTILSEGMKNRIELHEILKDEFGKTAIDDGIKIAEESGAIVRVPKEEISKENRRKAYYRIPSANDTEHPVSQLSIDMEKQEDTGHMSLAQNEWFDSISESINDSSG